MLELVYNTDLKSVARKGLRVRISPVAPFIMNKVYFDMNSSDYWSSFNDLFSGKRNPECLYYTYMGCLLSMHPYCKYRQWLEINPFTRPLKPR